MSSTANLARETSASVTQGTITLGGAVSGYLTWANAKVPAGVVQVGIKDGSSSEVGRYIYDGNVTITALAGSGNRVPETSTGASNAPLSLSGSAEIYLTMIASDLAVMSHLSHRAHGGI